MWVCLMYRYMCVYEAILYTKLVFIYIACYRGLLWGHTLCYNESVQILDSLKIKGTILYNRFKLFSMLCGWSLTGHLVFECRSLRTPPSHKSAHTASSFSVFGGQVPSRLPVDAFVDGWASASRPEQHKPERTTGISIFAAQVPLDDLDLFWRSCGFQCRA